jgi:hypothetical protein
MVWMETMFRQERGTGGCSCSLANVMMVTRLKPLVYHCKPWTI